MNGQLRSVAACIVLLGSFLPAQLARACPDCAIGRQVRASFFDERFWPALVAVTLPILIIAALSAGLHHIGKRDATWVPRRTRER
jgi:hypothetical protein